MPARILVIDDNPENLELMTYLLRAFGHTTLKAMDGEEGLQLARRETSNLILCDLHMPKLDGFERSPGRYVVTLNFLRCLWWR